jgi:N-acetylglucosamine kinase-like BadF-type ATPase
VRDVEGPGANVATLDSRLMTERVTELLRSLGEIRPSACCAGAAGAEVAEGRARLESLLGRLLPDCAVAVVHDARLVLAAAGVESGIALIAGTGSVAFGRSSDGREAQRGGWGWMLGDEGGGVWIAREAARLVLARSDAGDPAGPLGEALLTATGAADARQLMAAMHARREPREWARLASTVFESADSDPGSSEIVALAGEQLARLVDQIRRALRVGGPVVLAGGLLLHQPRLEVAVRGELGDVECIRLAEPPVEGAVRLAEGMLRR